MKLWLRANNILRNWFSKRQVELDLNDEVRAYVDLLAEEKTAAGMSAQAAHRAAMVELGGIEQVKQAVREDRAGTGLELLWMDIRYGFRQLRRNPGFTFTAVVTLGVGIGATAAIFSAVYSLLLRPLPYPDSQQLMYLSYVAPSGGSNEIASPDFVAAQSSSKTFQQLAAYGYGVGNLTGAGEPIRVTRIRLTANFLPMLDVHPQLGRTFVAEDDQPGGPPVILLSDHLWRAQFNADPSVIGKTVAVDDKTQTVIGVLPQHFSFPDPALEPDVYAPGGLDHDTNLAIDKPVFGMHVIGRLGAGVTTVQAQSEMQAFFMARAKGYPAAFGNFGKDRHMVVEALQRHMTGDDRKPMYILLVCVLAVLLIACANVANLQLARAAARQYETALRGALGASRMRLIRQFLVESLLLSSFAAAVGIGVAAMVVQLVRHGDALDSSQSSSAIGQILRLSFGKLSTSIEMDAWVVAFTIGIALISTLLSGLVPAIASTRIERANALQGVKPRMSAGREQRLLRHSLLVIEVALAVALLASAGLLVRSFVKVMSYESGFDPRNTLTASTLLSRNDDDPTPQRVRNFVDPLLSRLQSLPGVESATIASALPLQPAPLNSAIEFEGVALPPRGSWPTTFVISVTPGYFRTMGTPILRGRPFRSEDNEAGARVAIVNQAFERTYFAGNALGKRFKTNVGASRAKDFTLVTIVGVASNVRHNGIEQEIQPEVFCPMDQVPQGDISIAIRTEGNPDELAGAMRHAAFTVDPQQPLFDIQSMEARISGAIAQRRLIMLLIACFALLAVILSAVGVYGVFAYSVTQRRHELGIRLALGASRDGVLQLIVIQAARLILIGSFFGVGTSLMLSRLLSSLLVGVTPHDALTLVSAWLLVTITALVASSIPAAAAARTDLLSVLHSE
jgi:predicted permease